jgi:hypothetical protein
MNKINYARGSGEDECVGGESKNNNNTQETVFQNLYSYFENYKTTHLHEYTWNFNVF